MNLMPKDPGSHKKHIYGQIAQLLIVFALIVGSFFALPSTIAWFSANKQVSGNGVSLTLDGSMPVELACDATAGTNASFHFLDGLRDGVIHSGVTAIRNSTYSNGVYTPGTPGAADKTLRAARLGQAQWWMGESSDFKDQEGSAESYISPCCSGQLTFYLIVNDERESVDCLVSLQGFYIDSEGSVSVKDRETNEVEKVSPVSDTNAISGFLTHHILLFADYDADTGYYSGWLKDGKFKVDLRDVQKGQAVKITLYWVWAGYFDNFIACDDSEENPLCVVGETDYTALLKDVRANPKLYFSEEDEKITVNSDLPNNIEAARTAYNLADSDIGVYTDYLQVSVSLQ